MSDVISWVFTVLVVPWLVLGGIFFAYPTVKRLKDQKDQFSWIIKVPIYLWMFLGVLSDVTFNVTWGSIIFRELPHEGLFTTRLKRHHYGDSNKQRERAAPWVRRVNLIDPGHV